LICEKRRRWNRNIKTPPNIIRQAGELGAKVIAFDVIFGRGDQTMAETHFEGDRTRQDAEQDSDPRGSSASLAREWEGRTGPLLSFSRTDLAGGLINVRADSDGVCGATITSSR